MKNKLRISVRILNVMGIRSLVLIAAFFSAEVHAEKVKFLIQGDTQKIIDQKPDDFLTTMENVLTDPVTMDADFVLQMGDIVESDADNSDRPGQYLTAQTGWRKLDGRIPYVLNLGNNDYAAEFLQYFPLSHYNIWSSFVSNYNDHRNMAHHFNAGGVDWLVISVRYNNATAEMNWAESLIQSHPDKKVIFISHAANSNGSEVSVLRKYENVVFVLCGHTASSHLTVTGDHGNKIGWVKTCHHSAVKDSYFCMVELDTSTGVADFRYYSPQYGKYWDESDAPYTDSQPIDSPWQWSGFDFGGPTPSNGVELISHNVPATLAPGETFSVSITVKNTGLDEWSVANGQKLGRPNPEETFDWAGSARVPLPHTVLSGDQVTFTFDVTAPTTLGSHVFKWQMVDDVEPNQEWFGPALPGMDIVVAWPTVNAVQNPSFETGASTPSDWVVPGSGYSRSDEDVLPGHGTYALKGTGVGALGSVKQVISLKPNTDYNISVRIKFESGGNGNVIFDTWDVFDGNGEGQFVLGSPNGDWQRYEGSFYNGSITSITLRVFTSTGFSGTFYVDDVIVEDPNEVIAPEGVVPELISLSRTTAESSIVAAGFSVGTITSNYSASVASGIVISQTPAAGTMLAEGMPVDLAVSAGLPPITTTVWDPAPGNRDWEMNDSWTGGAAPLIPFQNHKVVFNIEGADLCTLSTGATVAQLVLGDNGTTGGTFLTLLNGAELISGLDAGGNVSWTGVGYNRDARMRVEQGAVFTTTSHLWIGNLSSSTASLDIVGGTVIVNAQIGLGWNGGSGYINLKSGELNLNRMEYPRSISGTSVIDIENGVMIIEGNQLTLINEFIDDGRITAFGGTATLDVDYDISNSGKTTITAAVAESGYSVWSQSWGVDIGSGSDNYDQDRWNNFYEYVFNGDPTNAMVHGEGPVLSPRAGVLLLTHLQRNDDTNLVYSLETSTNLVSGTWTNADYTVTGTHVMGGGTFYDEVTNRVSTLQEQSFIRVFVEQK